MCFMFSFRSPLTKAFRRMNSPPPPSHTYPSFRLKKCDQENEYFLTPLLPHSCSVCREYSVQVIAVFYPSFHVCQIALTLPKHHIVGEMLNINLSPTFSLRKQMCGIKLRAICCSKAFRSCTEPHRFQAFGTVSAARFTFFDSRKSSLAHFLF